MCASPYSSLRSLWCLHDLDIHLQCSSWDLLLKISELLIITKDISLQLAYRCFIPHIFAERDAEVKAAKWGSTTYKSYQLQQN
jgi:hypothetical protein